MSEISQKELDGFRADARAWFSENVPAKPEFMMPLTFMEVGTDQQFDFLRGWQKKVYEAGYLGAAWPKKYGGGGLAQALPTARPADRDRANRTHHRRTVWRPGPGPMRSGV